MTTTGDKWRHRSAPMPPTDFRVFDSPSERAPPRPSLLWHYTTFNAFESITRTNSLWASRMQFLNDEEEMRHGWDVIFGAIQNRLMNLRIALHADDAEYVRSLLARATNITKCVACFSESRDQLSQWRGYSANSLPIAVGFDRQKISQAAEAMEHGWKLEHCIYIPADKEAAVASIVNAVVSGWPIEISDREERRKAILGLMDAVWDECLHVAPRLKHAGFSEEAEVRLISMPYSTSNEGVWKFRGSGRVVPYVEFPLPGIGNYVREILVGPGSQKDVLAQAVRHLGIARHINADVTISSIPYR